QAAVIMKLEMRGERELVERETSTHTFFANGLATHNCYARTFAERFRGVPGHHFEQGFDLMLAVFDTMRRADHHTYQVLTKRPSRAVLLVPQILETLGGSWPQHIWMGVSVENQDYTW